MHCLLLLVLLYNTGCNNEEINEKQTKLHPEDSTTKQHTLKKDIDVIKPISKDTIIFFSIDDISTEGSEVEANYVSDTIKTATWNIFSGSGKDVIKYTFLRAGLIEVFQKSYIYKVSLNDVESAKDMKLTVNLHYTIDTNGVLMYKLYDKNIINLFADFKKTVPMTLPKNNP